MSRQTIDTIRDHKNKDQPLVCLTAYTTPMATLLDPYVDLFIIGDSVGMVLYGMENTLGVDLEMMIRHGQAVMRARPKALCVIDMPYGSYEGNKEQALDNASRLLEESGCDAVKLEGGQEMADTVAYLTAHNIQVMGHIGLLPQSVEKEGGYRIKGKDSAQAGQILRDAQAIERAGVFSGVIEGTIDTVAADITKAVSIPIIGIGASPECDGQVLVTEDMLGMNDRTPKFVKHYARLQDTIRQAAEAYAEDVKARRFPAREHTYQNQGRDNKTTGAL